MGDRMVMHCNNDQHTSRHKSTASECRPEWKEALTINTEANDTDIELKETALNTKLKKMFLNVKLKKMALNAKLKKTTALNAKLKKTTALNAKLKKWL